ncbi:MAG: hypothetical protein JSW17_04370 [Candidatus Omnitrophota bacterium]|nr:MAG: hypothetical protein JSW17_04370 [Candidatus Omnitrophota bacterium]
MEKPKIKYAIILAVTLFLFFPLFAQVKREKDIGSIPSLTAAKGVYQERNFVSIETNNFTIYYEPDVNLKRVYRKLRARRFYLDAGSKPSALSGFDEKIAYRMNLIFEKVKQVLGMYPIGVEFNIKIFKDPKMVYDKYFKISKKNEKVRSFYVHAHRTVYISEATISDSVMAHEMAHAIVNFYFIIKPPETVSEMMAIYVDSHLED